MKLALLLISCALLVSWGGLYVRQARPMRPAAATLGSTPAPVSATAEAAPAEQSSAETPALVAIAPLFRPATAPAATQAPQPGESFTLVGLAGPPAARAAFLRDRVDARAFTARAGERVLEWTLEQIDSRCVVLRRATRRETVCL